MDDEEDDDDDWKSSHDYVHSSMLAADVTLNAEQIGGEATTLPNIGDVGQGAHIVDGSVPLAYSTQLPDDGMSLPDGDLSLPDGYRSLPDDNISLVHEGVSLPYSYWVSANNKEILPEKTLPTTREAENAGTTGLNMVATSTKSQAIPEKGDRNLASPLQKGYLQKPLHRYTTAFNNLFNSLYTKTKKLGTALKFASPSHVVPMAQHQWQGSPSSAGEGCSGGEVERRAQRDELSLNKVT